MKLSKNEFDLLCDWLLDLLKLCMTHRRVLSLVKIGSKVEIDQSL